MFYAVNPDLALFRETHLARCSANDVPPLEFADASMFRRSRLLFTRPRFECLRGDLAAAGVVHDGTRARSCTANLTREVEFGGDDAFLGPEHLEASVSCRAAAAPQSCPMWLRRELWVHTKSRWAGSPFSSFSAIHPARAS